MTNKDINIRNESPNVMTLVKICGIKDLPTAQKAKDLGVDYIGLVFYQNSPRWLSVMQAKLICKKVPDIKKVALFVNEKPEWVRQIADIIKPDVLQFHGEESPEYCKQFSNYKVWKAIKIKDESSLDQLKSYTDFAELDGIILDTYVEGQIGGTGEIFNWDIAKKAKKYHNKIILAGGLNPKNVREAIKQVEPYAVDVSSGVESIIGVKSNILIGEFVKEIK